MAVGIDLDFIIFGTVSIAVAKSGNGTSKLISFLGNGNSFNKILAFRKDI